MINVQKTFSFWVWPYFYAMVVIGAFFLINITLAIIKLRFTVTLKEEKYRKNDIIKKEDMEESFDLFLLRKLKKIPDKDERRYNLDLIIQKSLKEEKNQNYSKKYFTTYPTFTRKTLKSSIINETNFISSKDSPCSSTKSLTKQTNNATFANTIKKALVGKLFSPQTYSKIKIANNNDSSMLLNGFLKKNKNINLKTQSKISDFINDNLEEFDNFDFLNNDSKENSKIKAKHVALNNNIDEDLLSLSRNSSNKKIKFSKEDFEEKVKFINL